MNKLELVGLFSWIFLITIVSYIFFGVISRVIIEKIMNY